MLKGKVLVISVLREVVDSAGSRATKLSVNDWNEQIKAASEEVTLGASAEPGARWPPRPYGTNVSLWEAVKDWQIKDKERNTDRSRKSDFLYGIYWALVAS